MNRAIAWVIVLSAAGAISCGKRRGTVIQNKGSDTMVNIAQAWAEEYQKVQKNASIAVSGGGSGTGIASIINGTVDVANASRDMKAEERDKAKANTGKDAVVHTVAYDALAVYLHPSNPLNTIDKDQLACIFAEGGKCGKWSDLGVEVPGCSGQEIVRVSRQSNSGTYQFFREWVVGDQGDFKLGSRDMQGSKDVVDLIQNTPCAIGYSGLGYKIGGVKTACVAKAAGEKCSEPSLEGAVSGTYPLSRALYMITLGEPEGEVARYLDWVRSDAGQVIVESSGYAPLPKDKRRPAPAP